ncbi:MAG: bifunctional diaminohydroxyphosphoribosylaminopyrimidine deaminase/5-amino-6-(5-phosphoribosylamino)uracil reductase RibD [Hyphomicrobiales bacterium]|nr:bifunctional diaminohydroxyphosphoribosylaminopyrimidine deaminase/5-amino-6-(5-phosphoribosylamino)uracil reductase RibD [Hyphomicrobiales bacterium]
MVNSTDQPKIVQPAVDKRLMQAAIRYARRHSGITGTNPSVACFIVAQQQSPTNPNANYWIAGRGVTAIGGRPHAEPIAIKEAGLHAKGATAYVTLEPCAHHGITAPCASTLINAGIKRVVSAQRDPDSRVDSKGFQMLLEAGIEVVEGVEAQQAAWGLRGYLSRKTRSRPWVTLKLAVTGDGYLGVRDGRQVAITGAVTNTQTHLLRSRADAVLVGSGTVINDDPSLNCRLPGLEDRSPVRVAVENVTQIATTGNFIDMAAKVDTYIACPQQNLKSRKVDLAHTSCKFIACDLKNGKIALPELLTDLGEIGVAFLMVEGGGKMASAFLENNLVDEVILYKSAQSLENLLDDIAPDSRDAWIHSPVLPDGVPEGFQLSAQWKYGSDRVTRYILNP